MRGRFLWLLVVSTSLATVGQPRACAYRELDRSAKSTVSFELYRDYLIVVRGSAGPLKGLNFLLDTGTSPSVLTPRVAEKLRLTPTPAVIAILSGNVQAGIATVPSLQFGPIRRDNLSMLIQDLSALQKALPVQIDGIVGLDVLGQSAFVIDYGGREIRFGPAHPMQGSIPLQMKEGLAVIDATVNHASVHLLLDTAAPGLILFGKLEEPGNGLNAGGQPLPKTLGDAESKPVRVSSFTLGEADFGHAAAVMVRNPGDVGHDFDGLMSPAALGITMIAVDLGRGTLAFAR